jgi:hypothetical protein
MSQTVNVSIASIRAGVLLLPYSLGSSLASMPVAWLLGAIQRRTHSTVGQKWVISAGLFIATTGFGEYNDYSPSPRDLVTLSSALLWLLDRDTRIIMQSFLPLVAGFGVGMLFHAPYQALTSALSPKELAAGTGAFFLVRFTGATVGLVCKFLSLLSFSFELTCSCSQSVAGAIYESSISRYGVSLAHSSASTSLGQVPNSTIHAFRVRQDAARYLAILNFDYRVQDVWTMCAPCLGSALLVRPVFVMND